MIRGCGECGAPLAADQRYCLQCGALDGARRVDPLATLGSAAEPAAPAEPLVAERRGPSRRVAAVAAAATLAVGLGVGAALVPGPAPTLAAAPQRVVALVIPSAAPDPATTTASEAPPPQVA